MDASEMLERSKRARRDLLPAHGFSPRAWNALSRAGYTNRDEYGVSVELDAERVRVHVISGEIWEQRGIGEKTILAVCEWLTKQDESQ